MVIYKSTSYVFIWTLKLTASVFFLIIILVLLTKNCSRLKLVMGSKPWIKNRKLYVYKEI